MVRSARVEAMAAVAAGTLGLLGCAGALTLSLTAATRPAGAPGAAPVRPAPVHGAATTVRANDVAHDLSAGSRPPAPASAPGTGSTNVSFTLR